MSHRRIGSALTKALLSSLVPVLHAIVAQRLSSLALSLWRGKGGADARPNRLYSINSISLRARYVLDFDRAKP